jgi:DNA-binding response OmpR family regulator
VNGTRISKPVRLRHGDVIALGEVTLAFQMTEETLLQGGEPTGALRVDVEAAEAWVGDRRLELTEKEFRALTFLYRRVGLLCSKEDLAAHVWPEYGGNVNDNNIEQLVSRLRRKLGEDPGGSRRLLTVRGLGYRLVAN